MQNYMENERKKVEMNSLLWCYTRRVNVKLFTAMLVYSLGLVVTRIIARNLKECSASPRSLS